MAASNAGQVYDVGLNRAKLSLPQRAPRASLCGIANERHCERVGVGGCHAPSPYAAVLWRGTGVMMKPRCGRGSSAPCGILYHSHGGICLQDPAITFQATPGPRT